MRAPEARSSESVGRSAARPLTRRPVVMQEFRLPANKAHSTKDRAEISHSDKGARAHSLNELFFHFISLLLLFLAPPDLARAPFVRNDKLTLFVLIFNSDY